MDIPRLYKVSALPTSPTAADDGVYFVRPNPSVGYVCYIITNGVAVQQDAATTAALTTLLGDYVKKDGTVPMTDSLPFDNNWKIGASSFQTGSFPFYYNGSVVAVMNQNGTFQILDATANNHAVTLGQVNGFLGGKVSNLQNVLGVGFSAGDFNLPPYLYHSSFQFRYLATDIWTEANFAKRDGSNTTGGSWKIDYILSDILQGAVGNGQVLNVLGNGTVHYGSVGVTQHRFLGINVNSLTVEVPGYGTGVVWNEFNFDPSTKANTSGNYPGLFVGGGDNWGNGYNNIFGGVSGTSGIDYLYGYNSGTGKGHILTIADFQTVIGLGNYALLSQVYTQSQALALFVGKNGVETIADTKTFTSSPIVPNGTLAGHTVNLGQLNTILSSYALASAIPTNNNQLANGANYITATALNGYVLQSSLNTQLTAYATIAGTQTFSGQITFGVAPLVPTGTLSGHTVNLGQMQNYVTTQVATQVTNQITNLGFAPKAHDYREITTNNTTVNVREFRRVVVVLADPSVITVSLSSDAFPGTVVTIQTTSVVVDVKMDHIKVGSADSSYTLDANRSLQVSFSEDLQVWIVEQDNSLS